ncbi:MAG: FG-GAP-like repeat-containing protein, partial [Thermoplasmatota archaeon]
HTDSGQVYLLLGKKSGWTKNMDLSESDVSFLGEWEGDGLKGIQSGSGDLNGDGRDDIVLNAGKNDDGGKKDRGQTYIIFGKGERNWWMERPLSSADAYFIGENPGDLLGTSAWSIGDVNGDGFPDIGLAAGYNDDNGKDAGKIYIFFGDGRKWSGRIPLSQADASFVGERPGDILANVVPAGDFNNDGNDDVLIFYWIFNPFNPTYLLDSKIYLVLGKENSKWGKNINISQADASFIGERPNDQFGYFVRGGGDVNNDNYDDFIVGSINSTKGGPWCGETYIVFGRDGGLGQNMNISQIADASFIGPAPWLASGFFGGINGDIDGDGYDDILISSIPESTGSALKGRVHIIYGKSTGWGMETSLNNADACLWGENNGHAFGFISSYSDVNGDGRDDILVTAGNYNETGGHEGKTYLFFGKPSRLLNDISPDKADVTFPGYNPEASTFVSPKSGDVNGDGYEDIFIISRQDNAGGPQAGQTFIYFGRPSGWKKSMPLLESDASFIGENSGDFSGGFQIQDLDLDGYDDMMFHASVNDDGGKDAGKVYIVYGKESLNMRPVVELENDYMTSQLENGRIGGEFDIKWYAADREDGSNIVLNIFYQQGEGVWNRIVSNITNKGSFIWNTEDPRIPDGEEYSIKIEAVDSSGLAGIAVTGFSFGIENPDPPVLDITYPKDGDVLSGKSHIAWKCTDDEDNSKDLKIDVYLSSDGGQNYEQFIYHTENTGTVVFNTTSLPDGDRYRLKMEVIDTSGLDGSDISGNFTIRNSPTVEILTPEADEVVTGIHDIYWNVNDLEFEEEDITLDLWIIGNDSSEWQLVSEGIEGSKPFEFDSSRYPNDDDYRLKLTATNPLGFNSSDETGVFAIFNDGPPGARFTSPEKDEIITGIYVIKWDSWDDTDHITELTYALYYKFDNDGIWYELALDQPNTGFFNWDTRNAVFDDGNYTLRLVVEDTSEKISAEVFVNFSIYNPDSPIVHWLNGPSEAVREGEAEFRWFADDPDPGETECLHVWIYVSQDGEDWVPVESDIPNENNYTMDVSGLEDGTHMVKFVFSDCKEGEFSRSTEYVFEDLVVNNINDAPVVVLVTEIDPEKPYRGWLNLTWDGSDADGDNVTYSPYYKLEGTDEWIPIPGAQNINETEFSWDISEMETGRYKVRIVATEDWKDGLEDELETISFRIEKTMVLGGQEEGDRSVEINSGLLFGVAAGFVVLALVIVWIMFLNVRKKRSEGEEREGLNGEGPDDEMSELDKEYEHLYGAPKPTPPSEPDTSSLDESSKPNVEE